ncbi:unnamed protein product [Protopolystoma xenopodis]|uniref:Uncharacterized protein n=1 Tax=Protopolystoma xenopodis TaxID=117903 RepID=A0A448WZM7_9PLAT|nr:unnamed protein product [Protopolystoma xenopodis]
MHRLACVVYRQSRKDRRKVIDSGGLRRLDSTRSKSTQLNSVQLAQFDATQLNSTRLDSTRLDSGAQSQRQPTGQGTELSAPAPSSRPDLSVGCAHSVLQEVARPVGLCCPRVNFASTHLLDIYTLRMPFCRQDEETS